MFTVFTGFDIIALIVLSLFLIGCDTKLGFIGLWLIYFLAGVWFKDWSFTGALTTLGNHWFDLLMYVLCYLAIGGVWSVFKWWLFVIDGATKYKELIAQYQAISTPAGANKQSWDDYRMRNGGIGLGEPPSVMRHKSMILDWISFWWYSMIRTILGDWMHKLIIGVYNIFYGMYDAIAKRAYAGIKAPE